jgi:hypothetical protein
MMLLRLLTSMLFICGVNPASFTQSIPLPEHPRPDFERPEWQNLNGYWNFRFDPADEGIQNQWFNNDHFDHKILVPYPWGSALSEVDDEADIAWYQRQITVDPAWSDQKTFLVIGASDWETTVWLDGQKIGSHQGGYTPFSFDLSPLIRHGQSHNLVIRVDDVRREFTLYGKQGYGNARGIWQTVYLEARGTPYLDAVHVTPDIDAGLVKVTAYLPSPAPEDLSLELEIPNATPPVKTRHTVAAGQYKVSFDVALPNARWWNLEDPFLYDATVRLGDDQVKTYFGMRKISVMDLPGTDYPYIALNNQPVYLQLALDQSYHPEGFYTFPSDQFMREEIERSKSIGLNGIRTHVKIDLPRKLYWADKLGLLVMADVPNSWGEPDKYMQEEAEYHLREMIKRDFNHPSIFSWIIFNETWGLVTSVEEDGREKRVYLPETQNWVASMYYLAKSLDPSRLVEDNSICCGRGHTETDINSWHAYLPGWEWTSHLQNISDNTFHGSTFDFETGFTQKRQPNINSECGNVWGYDGSTGDVDWSFDYHRMMNTFRMYPKIAGWLYTELHDVINEWNGYWRFDRSEKITGLNEMVPGMSLQDLHAPLYISTGNEICLNVKGGSTVEVPLYLSSMSGADYGEELHLKYHLSITNNQGDYNVIHSDLIRINYRPWMQRQLEPLPVTMPDQAGLALLTLQLLNTKGEIMQRNFMHFVVEAENSDPDTRVITVAANDFSAAEWSKKQWEALDGKKVNGAGKGHFTYTFPLPDDLNIGRYKSVFFRAELSAKELFVKDQSEFDRDQDYMRGSRVAPSSNPNAYPMTDETTFPSEIIISVNGQKISTTTLADDPADHRGVLSWHAQPRDKKLREAGSYGYLVSVPISKSMLRKAAREGKIEIAIRTTGEGGIAIYGKDFGRYPLDPCLVFK